MTHLLANKDATTFPRDDYCECTENRLIIFGQNPPWVGHFLKPVAIHQARQIACNIYVNKSARQIACNIYVTNHQWNLIEEVVPFAFFSKHVSSTAKKDMAAKLLEIPVPKNFCLGKPVFCQITCQTGLSNLLGPESHTLFSILGINTDYLAKPIEQWTEQPGYQEAEKFVCMVKVVNDTTER